MKSKDIYFKYKDQLKKVRDDLVVDKLNAIEWGILGVLLLLISITLYYCDNMVMYLNYFWINESLFEEGSIRFLGSTTLPYGVVQQWLCELWVLPLNIVNRFHKYLIANTFTIIWFKFSMIIIMTLCMSDMIKIAEIIKISRERTKWMLILFCSTILVALPVFHISQSDILYAYIILLGIKAFLKDDYRRFIIFFALAISCKIIAVLVFIPLVLLREKRILYVLRDSVLGTVILIIERVWFRIIDKIDIIITRRIQPLTAEKKTVVDGVTTVTTISLDEANESFFWHFYHKMLFFEFPAIRKGYVAAVLVFLFVMLCIWCYAQKKEDGFDLRYKCMYAVSVSWLIFFANASPSPYWIVAMYPTLFLLIFMYPERLRVNMLLCNVFTLTMFMVYVMNTDWVYGGPSNLDFLLFKGLLKEGHDSNNGPAVSRYLNNLGIDNFMNVIVAICLAAIVAFSIINHYKSTVKEELSEKEEKTLMHGFAIWQIGFLAIWYMVNVWVVQRW